MLVLVDVLLNELPLAVVLPLATVLPSAVLPLAVVLVAVDPPPCDVAPRPDVSFVVWAIAARDNPKPIAKVETDAKSLSWFILVFSLQG